MCPQFISRAILCLFFTTTLEVFANFQGLLKNRTFNDRVCSGADQIGVSVGHEWTSQCLYSCVRDPSCLSVFYNNDTGSCTKCTRVYSSDESLSEGPGSVYYAINTKLYGERCFKDDKCGDTNQVCWTDTCICQIGYSYHNATGTCVEECVTYGTTFQKYPQRRIDGNNIHAVSGKTLEECMQACIDYQTRTCISFEYDQDRSQCNLSKESALTVPGAVSEISYFNFYTRNCD